MHKLFFTSILLCFFAIPYAQTFTASGGPIPDNATETWYPITVGGIGNINSNLGLATICLNISHTWNSQLEIQLRSPDGTRVPVSIRNGDSSNNFTATCFLGTATQALENGTAPFTGVWFPDGYFGLVNNGQNADGNWNLCIKDISPGESGTLINWSIGFSNSLPPAPPACNNHIVPGNTCAAATPVCSFFGFCGFTSATFTSDSWPELDNEFCGTVQNNAFVKFVATGHEMNFNVWITSSTNHDGIQVLFFDGGCGSGAVRGYGCYSPIRPGASPTVISATGLTAGNMYYMMIDGFAGDECNYIIDPLPSVGGLAVSASSTSVCNGKTVMLNASGGNGTYSWSGPGLHSFAGNAVTATVTSNATYTVSSVDPGGICPTTKSVNVSVIALPAPPVTSADTLNYCFGSSTVPLTATGTGLLWYLNSTGGSGVPFLNPSSSNVGVSTYYVSQTLSCESPRVPVYVRIKPTPSLGADIRDSICFGQSTNLTTFFPAGVSGNWLYNNNPIQPPTLVNAPGPYTFIVSNIEGCSDSAIVRLTVQPLMRVFAGADTIAVRHRPIQLHATSAATWSWSPAHLLNSSHVQNPVAILGNDQEFIVTATDVAGCIASDTIMVKIIQGTTYYVPNAFTPNGDGLNDIFRAIPVGIKKTDYFRVLNRYGRILYETSDPLAKGWDGSFLGAPQSPGAYVWFIKGVDIHGKPVEMKGTVILLQ